MDAVKFKIGKIQSVGRERKREFLVKTLIIFIRIKYQCPNFKARKLFDILCVMKII